jgi:hypothetical protein
MARENHMSRLPNWYLPAAIIAVLWNLMGCGAYLADVMMTPQDAAKLTAAEQAIYASRPVWAVAATAIAVWGGALGCIGLILRKSWSQWLLLASLLAVIIQDIWLFALSDAGKIAGSLAYVLQGLVLVVAVALVLLARRARASGWFR